MAAASVFIIECEVSMEGGSQALRTVKQKYRRNLSPQSLCGTTLLAINCVPLDFFNIKNKPILGFL